MVLLIWDYIMNLIIPDYYKIIRDIIVSQQLSKNLEDKFLF